MKAFLALAVMATAACLAPLSAGELSGQYVEARTCDVWVGACFANSDMNVTGKHAVLAWKIEKGEQDGVQLDGLSVVAVVEATDTLGLPQSGEAKAVLLVDKKASARQREALIAAAKRLGGALVKNIVTVDSAPISVSVGDCPEGGCAKVDAGVAKVETRCFKAEFDKTCGHEDNYYPPLTQGLRVSSAMVTKNNFTGKGFDKTWEDSNRRAAYIGTFSTK